jgi:hypothetical protein
MSNIRGWVIGLVVAVCILGLVAFVRPAQHSQRATWLLVRGTTAQQAGSKAPPADWLLIRRIPHP